MIKGIYKIAIAVVCITGSVRAQTVTLSISGSWALSVSASNLTGGAGSDLTPVYASNSDQVSADINKVVYGNFWDWFLSYSWRIDVRRQDADWHSDLGLYARRTGGGFGFGSISGGAAYQEISESDALFFSGSGRRYDIPVQYELRGMSVEVPPGNFSTTVTYTVTEL